MKIILTGFMGTGKSEVGRGLAKRLGLSFIDVDEQIGTSAGMGVPEIFASEGESGFRRRERELIAGLANCAECVIATGGGAVLDPENVRNLRKAGGVLICLQAEPRIILERIGADADRPLLHGPDRLARIQELLHQRAAAYAQADLSVETSELQVEEVIEWIVQRLPPEPARVVETTR